ncbi:YhcN/YlaJ family sporulation lipoprotein [Bhargavaea cecembensis]|uniref:YhcN/YlaJ family sporulation lipoprotein n=1 Tax=Bhargavaea cecembensis TaxID=394098 RepID=UPI000694AEEA|nr:YhcN/YlaJ family sporulation lipoprotein [Bhargavaea cecembensis]
MKKILMSLSALFLALALGACGGNDDNNADNGNTGNTGNTTDNAGTGDDNHSMTDEGGTNGGTGDNGNTGDQAAGDGNGDNDLRRDEDVADKVKTVEGVEDATVLMTDQNAYVGVNLKEGTEETEDLQTQIKDQVKKIKPEIGEVYVSANPDFAKQMSDYGTRIDEGEPVEGFFDEFSDVVRRMFPDAQ